MPCKLWDFQIFSKVASPVKISWRGFLNWKAFDAGEISVAHLMLQFSAMVHLSVMFKPSNSTGSSHMPPLKINFVYFQSPSWFAGFGRPSTKTPDLDQSMTPASLYLIFCRSGSA